MTIYIDIVLLENLVMNYIILYATSIIAKVKINHVRILVASFIGSVYAILEYVSIFKIYSNFILKTLLSVIMVFVAMNPQNVKIMFKNILLLYLTAFVFAGVSIYLIYVIKPQEILIRDGKYVGTYALKTIFLGGLLGTIIIIIAFSLVKNKLNKKDLFCDVKVKLNNKEIILKTMIDTGNVLKEPITGNPVMVVEHTALYEILPRQILQNLELIIGGDFTNIPEEIQIEYMPRLKLIPFSSLGKQNGMLLGIKAEEVEILDEQNKSKNKNVIIGIYNKSLTKRGEYRALVGIELC